VDELIWAEIPDEKRNPLLHHLVLKFMIHRPCGIGSNQPCMLKNKYKCSKRYPRAFNNHTKMTENGYPEYRRRSPENNGNTGILHGNIITNQWVVPYNPVMLLKYRCHLNFEMCATVTSVKYIYKYLLKGNDKITMELKFTKKSKKSSNRRNANDKSIQEMNEILRYQNGRFLTATDSCYRLFRFPHQYQFPSVLTMAVHLENQHTVIFHANADKQQQQQILANCTNTTLTAWMENNRFIKNKRLTTSGKDVTVVAFGRQNHIISLQ